MSQELSTGARLNLFLLRLTRGWLRIVLVILGVYITLPWVAPTLMRLGAQAPAQFIYNLYRPMCHQFAFRTFFLFGEQPAYPLAASTSPLTPFEAFVGVSRIPAEMRARRAPQPPFNVSGIPEFHGIDVPPDIAATASLSPEATFNFGQFQLRSAGFVGNPQMGYKTTLCERDIAIYTMLFVGGLIYSRPAVRLRLRPVPLWLYFILGVAPIGIDGFSQWFGYPPLQLWPPRETLPEFRVLTGGLFGLMNAWLGFPYINMAMQDTRNEVEAKLRRAGIIA